MSRKYKFHNKGGLYFVTFSTVYWISLFIREVYFQIIIDSLKYCQENKGLRLYCWCIMPNHIHMIIRASDNNPGDILRDFKSHTSKQLQKKVVHNPKESRKKWLLWIIQHAGSKTSNVVHRQLWQQHNHPIELYSSRIINQKANYIHNNPVKAGFVTDPEHWKYSSAVDYAGGRGVIDIEYL